MNREYLERIQKRIWQLQTGLVFSELVIIDPLGETALNHSDYPHDEYRFVSSKDGMRYKVISLLEDAIIVCRRPVTETKRWSDEISLSVEDWVDHKMKKIIFDEGGIERLPFIHKNGDMVTHVQYLDNYVSEQWLPRKVSVNGEVYQVSYSKVNNPIKVNQKAG